MRDRLFILEHQFEDPAFPGDEFYCEHCVLMEGLLAAFPHLNHSLDVVRVAWSRPRGVVVDLLGPEHQELPLLVLADGAEAFAGCQTANGHSFVNEKSAILAVLAERHGLPRAHP